MRTLWKLLAVAIALTLAGSASAEQHAAVPKQVISSTSPGGNSTTSVYSNGDISAVRDDSGHKTDVTLKMVGHVAVVTTDDGITRSTSVVDIDAVADWKRTHPTQAYNLDSMRAFTNKHRTLSFERSGNANLLAAGKCDSQLQTMLDAADSAVSACAGGGGILCSLAAKAYFDAKDAYNACAKSATPE